MKEIREIFETVRTYCGMMLGENRAAKSVMENTESILAPMAGEDAIVHERLVSVTSAGAGENQNEIIQSYPSPEFLNSLPFIKKFYPTPRWGEGKVTDVALDNNPNSTETDHASMPLGIFASKSVSHKANVDGVGTPPYGATHVALSDKSRKSAFTLDESFTHVAHCDKFRRAAFTLAEVLITLGIIGVVAALTLPTLIQNHQKQVYVTQLKKAYSTINNAYNKMAADEGVVDWNQTYCSSFLWVENDLEATNANVNECFDRIAKQMKVIKYKRYGEPCNETWCEFFGSDSNDYWLNLTSIMVTADGITYLFNCGSAYIDILVDVNGVTKGPNKAGRDVFEFTQKTSDSGSYYNSLAPYGIIYWNPDAWKNCSATNLSTACTAKVLMEGKMNY